MQHRSRFLLTILAALVAVMAAVAGRAAQASTLPPSAPDLPLAIGQVHCVSTQAVATSAPCTNATTYTSVQMAIDAASSGDEIRIGAGVYHGQRYSHVVSLISKSLTLRGGYSGGWASPSPSAATILDGQGLDPVVQIFDAGAVLERLTITGGNNSGSYGGGIDANLSGGYQLTLIDVVVSDNQAKGSGAGIFSVGGSTSLIRTQVVGNTSGEDGGGFYGLTVSLTDSLIAGNQAARNAGGIAALHITGERTRILDNTAASGIGGGVLLHPSNLGNTLALTATQIISNTAGDLGGGLYMGVKDAALVGTLIADNRAAAVDGLLIDPSTQSAQVKLTNVTIASASVSPHSAIQLGLLSPSTPVALTMTNTAVVSHSIGIARPGNSTLAGDYNAFSGNGSNQLVDGSDTALPFAHLLASAPRFVEPLAHNFHLRSDSPLINAGDPGRSYVGQSDIDGDTVPFGGLADIGADEYTGAAASPPSIQALNPASASAGGGPLILNISGANFQAGALVLWDGMPRPTTFVSSTQLIAQIGRGELAAEGTPQIIVRNPDDSTSNARPFTIKPQEKVYLALVSR